MLFGALVLGLLSWLLWSMLVWLSYFHGWKVTLNFNAIGEGVLELVLIPMIAVLSLLALAVFINDTRRHGRG